MLHLAIVILLLVTSVHAGDVHENGLYSTIAGYISISKEKPAWRDSKLPIPTFAKPAKIREIQRGRELAVLLLGLDGKADGPIANAWGKMLHEKGYSVLTFDSTFSASMNRASKHGVPGYLPRDTEAAAKIISAYIGSRPGKFDKIRIYGVSYGGLQALEMSAMQKDGILPFKLESANAYSPPVNIGSTAAILDEWFATDRQDFKLTELAWKVQGHEPVGPGKKIPFTDSEMRACIAAVFRMTLAETVFYCDTAYALKILPRGNIHDGDYVAKDHANTFGFRRYIEDVCAPYWRKSSNEIVEAATLKSLLTRAGDCRVYLTDDDPFNGVDELPNDPRITVVKDGGHVGFTNQDWLKKSF